VRDLLRALSFFADHFKKRTAPLRSVRHDDSAGACLRSGLDHAGVADPFSISFISDLSHASRDRARVQNADGRTLNRHLRSIGLHHDILDTECGAVRIPEVLFQYSLPTGTVFP